MDNFIYHLLFWHWLGLAAILFILEMTTGTGFLLWIGISAGVVGGLLFLFPAVGPGLQFILFALFALLSAIGWKLYLKKHPTRTDKPTLNRRGEQYVGRVFTLESPIINGVGVVHVDDSTWRIRCSDLPAGARIEIIDVDGVVLIAKPKHG